MGRKKKRPAPSAAERIFCYYCERKFPNEQTLVTHQKEKHLRCPTCNKRLFSISGLVIHSAQVHNVQVNTVPNAIEGRTSTAVDVVGMKGIPPDYYQQNAAKVARTDGNLNGGPHAQAGGGGYAQYSGHAAAQGYYQYPPAPAHGGPHGYAGYGNGYAGQYASGFQQQPYPGQYYQAYPPRHGPYAQPYNPAPAPVHPAAQPAAAGATSTTPRPLPATQASNASNVASSVAAPAVSNAVAAVPPSSAPTAKVVAHQVKVVFDSLEVSMEEMRARLPRYKLA